MAFVASGATIGQSDWAARHSTAACARRGAPAVRPRGTLVRMADDGEAARGNKKEVKDYFNGTGFERWNRIYSESKDLNPVQQQIRDGHQEMVDQVVSWLEEDPNLSTKMICDAGCGVGSLAMPLAERGVTVFASDISKAMVAEAQRRASVELGPSASRVNFYAADLESLTGSYDVVCCIDVLIHYPEAQMREMLAKLASLTKRRLIFSVAPKTVFLGVLKKVGELFPGSSKATRAYLHSEDLVKRILAELDFKLTRTSTARSNFYFSTVFDAEKDTERSDA